MDDVEAARTFVGAGAELLQKRTESRSWRQIKEKNVW
jgi:hypothetical protein